MVRITSATKRFNHFKYIAIMRKYATTVLVLLAFVLSICSSSYGQATHIKSRGSIGKTIKNDNLSMPEESKDFADTYSINFETEVDWTFNFLPWTVVDVDGLPTYGMTDVTWLNSGDPQAFIVFNPATTDPPITDDPEIQPHLGAKFGACLASVPDAGQGNDDWFISDQVLINGSGASFNFWAKTYTDLYGLERFNVGISTTGNSPSDFTIISGSPYVEAPMTWTEYSYDLSSYAGQSVYVAIQCVSYDAFVFMIDDLVIDPGTGGGGSDCDDFDSYVAGSLLCPQSSLWTTWDNNPGGPSDGYVSNAISSSPSNSLAIEESVLVTDIVYDLGQTTTGTWDVSLDIFVPSGGNGAYYNVMQDMELFGSANEWGFQVYLKSDGTGYYYDADFNQTDFSYNIGAWNQSSLVVSLDASLATYYLNGSMIGQWQWDVAGPNKLGAINIFATADGTDNPKFYIDNVCFTSPGAEPDIDVNPTTLTISQTKKGLTSDFISSNTESLNKTITAPHKKDRIIVRFMDDVTVDIAMKKTNKPSLNELIHKYRVSDIVPVFMDNGKNNRLKQESGLLSIYSINFSSSVDLSEVMNHYQDNAFVIYAEPDFIYYPTIIPSDPLYSDQWGLNNTGQAIPYGGGGTVGTIGADINAENAWDIQTGSSSVIVSIIDEGVDLSHPEFTGRLLQGYDFFDNDPDPNPVGDGAHGTACAGIAAASNDGVGVVGVAWNVMILPVRVLGPGGGSSIQVANGITFSADEGADILSLSLGSYGYSSTMESAVNYAYSLDAVILGAAGNDNSNNGGQPFYPACYTNCISVGALSPCNDRKTPSTCDNESWWGSNYGGGLDFLAPGVRIFTTDISGTSGYSSTNYTTTFNGTSSACPFAAGIAALLRSENPTLTNSEIWDIMQNTCVDLGSVGYDDDSGYGRLDAYQALLSAGGGGSNNSFNIQNLGNAVLTINSITENEPWLSTSGYPATPFTLNPGNGQDITVDVDWGTLGGAQQTGIITISSDDLDEPNVTVTVTAIPGPSPDLIVQNQMISPATVSPGDLISSSCDVSNIGTVTSGSCSLKYFLSQDITWDVSDTYLSSDDIDTLQGGATSLQNKSLTIPGTTSAGTYYILFFVDADDEVIEENENNNVSYSQLTVTMSSPYILVEPSVQNVDYQQGYFIATVQSNVAWEVFENCPWLSCDPMSGQNDDSFVVVYEENNTGAIRTYTIIVNGGGASDNLIVVQDYITSINEENYIGEFVAYPNPFSTEIYFEYEVTSPAAVELSVYNHMGARVDMIRKNHVPGKHTMKWISAELPAGLYFYCFEVNGQKISGKIVKAN